MKQLLTTLALIAFGAAILTPGASADFGIHGFNVTFVGPDGAGVTQAGSHPYALKTTFEVNTETIEEGIFPDESIKDFNIAQVPGFIGDQTAVPPCSTLDFLTKLGPSYPNCANGSAVGLVTTEVGTAKGRGAITSPLYNLDPAPGKAAKLGFWAQGIPVAVEIGLSEEPPYNLLALVPNISQGLEVFSSEVTIWGVPADPTHDSLRGKCVDINAKSTGTCLAGTPPRPFLTLPRACNGPLATEYELDSWQSPGIFTSGFALTHDDAIPPNPQGMSGCGKLGFGPRTSAQPSTHSAESSSGLDFEIDVNDEGLKNPEGIAQSDIDSTAVVLPKGVTVNPSSAEGLGVCALAQYEDEELETAPGEGCPDAAKLGSIEAIIPLLEDHPVRGNLYLAQQDDPVTPKLENPFGSLIALYLIFRDPELGIFVKLAAEVEPDPVTGQLVTFVEEIPPFPLAHINVHLRSGPRAPLITPPACGSYTTEAILAPSSGAEPLTTTSNFTIDSGVGGGPCPPGGIPPFHPGLTAGSVNNAGGAYSPFGIELTRGDGEQDMTRFSAILPKGVTGKIAGIAKCGDQAIAEAKTKTGRQEKLAPSCPTSSQIGHVSAGAGGGSALTYVPGSLYLAGPYGGDPLSIVAIVPAVAGPFDAGTVVNRVALALNPETYEVEADGAHSDPFPHILKGIPLKVRDIRAYVDRPAFMLNPTSCKPTMARATLFGSFADVFNPADDVPVSLSSRYQAASCASLAFKPKLSLKLKGGTKRGDHPALKSLIEYPSGGNYANLGKAVITLPPSEFIDNAHIQNPCTRIQFKANQCPPGSLLGTAKATTPLLDEPLEGPVYFRSNGGERLLPDIVIDLHGTFHVVAVGHVDSKNARLRTTFENLPDAPATKITVDLNGGKKGLLVNNRNLCAHKLQAKVNLTGQNGRRYDTTPAVVRSCGNASKRKR